MTFMPREIRFITDKFSTVMDPCIVPLNGLLLIEINKTPSIVIAVNQSIIFLLKSFLYAYMFTCYSLDIQIHEKYFLFPL